MHLILNCPCGHKMRVEQEAWGQQVRCAGCGDWAPVNAGTAAPEAIDREEQVNRNACARCGHGFRGDWDRHESERGILCHICFNQVKESAEPEEAETPAMDVAEELDLNPPPLDDLPAPEESGQFERQRQPVRDWVRAHPGPAIFIVISTLLLASVAILPAEVMISSLFASAYSGLKQGETVPAAVRIGLTAITELLHIFSVLYLSLLWTSRLPNDRLWPNVIAVGAVSCVLLALSLIGINFFLNLLAMILSVGIIVKLYELEGQEILLLVILWLVLSPVFVTLQFLLLGIAAAG